MKGPGKNRIFGVTKFGVLLVILIRFTEGSKENVVNTINGNELNERINFLAKLLTDDDYDDEIAHKLSKRHFSPPLAVGMSRGNIVPYQWQHKQYLGSPQWDDLQTIKNRRSSGDQPEAAEYVPSGSVDALTNLNGFFSNLKETIQSIENEKPAPVIENKQLTNSNIHQHLRKEYLDDKPSGSAAFLHAIRNYRPSHRIRSLVAIHPEGYASTQFNDPNFLWAGLGK